VIVPALVPSGGHTLIGVEMSLQIIIVGVPACLKHIGAHDYHVVGGKYVRALIDVAGVVPILLPAVGKAINVAGLLDQLDGLFLTGSPSNIDPSRYGQKLLQPQIELDPARDESNLALIEAALARRIPIFGVCRGLQELNVALGGTLHQAVHETAMMSDHRADMGATVEEQYGPAHDVVLAADGMLSNMFGNPGRITVNSVHAQGIERLADVLEVEATAADGLIEAVRVRQPDGFALAVQWHPEWRATENPQSVALFRAFGEACRQFAQAKRNRGGAVHMQDSLRVAV